MTNCESCGRPPENGQATHWLGCEGINPAEQPQIYTEICEHEDCGQPKKPWSGKGAKPKYCVAGHKKEK